MGSLEISLVESAPFRLCIQAITFLIAAIVTQMVYKEYLRNRNSFLKYISLSFLAFSLKSAFLLCSFILSAIKGSPLPESYMPLVDHFLKAVGIIFFIYAFVVTIPAWKVMERYFLIVNLTLLTLSAPIIMHHWLYHLSVAPTGQGRFAFFWGDMAYEVWLTLLLTVGGYAAYHSKVAMKRAFLSAIAILFAMELLHIWNIYLSNNTISSIVLAERLLQVPFFYVIIVAIHNEIINEINRLNSSREVSRNIMFESTIQALAGSLELKDSYTHGHAERVTMYSMEIGRRLGIGEEELQVLYLGAILHDIGKIGIHEDILRKPCSLLDVEIEEFRKHPEAGAGIIEKIEALQHLKPTVLYHHERWDGAGYPIGLHGEAIPLHARIVAVADAFDAMTTDRPYRRQPFDRNAAINELVRCKSSQFDPSIVDTFVEYHREAGEENGAVPLIG
jgi:HD-GYP domain-containing protein (c-di-GMP phosphodiesterase class II)